MPTQTTNDKHADIDPILAGGDEQQVRERAVKQLEDVRDAGALAESVRGPAACVVVLLRPPKRSRARRSRRRPRTRACGNDACANHIREVKPKELSPADLYLFSSPGRFGKPIGSMRRFLKKVKLPAGTRYAILTTEAAPKPDKKTGRMPTEQELTRYQRVRPIMNEILQGKGLVNIAQDEIRVTGLKGPLEEGGRRRWTPSQHGSPPAQVHTVPKPRRSRKRRDPVRSQTIRAASPGGSGWLPASPPRGDTSRSRTPRRRRRPGLAGALLRRPPGA
jgi:hypothetical protein